jgi:hypothetical protein
MKQLLVIFIVSLFIMGCGEEYYDALIKNESNKTVLYNYNGSSDSLDPLASKQYTVRAYTQAPHNISVQTGALSIKLTQNYDTYSFEDIPAIDMYVLNTLSVDVTIKADEYIEHGSSTELIVPSDTEVKTAKIYTLKPTFKIISPEYNINVEYIMGSDNIMHVTIK